MDRRLFTVLDVLLLVAFVYTLGAQPIHWGGTFTAEPVPADAVEDPSEYYNSTELSPECRRLAHALAAGQTVSTKGYRITIREMAVTVKKTTLSDGWRLGNVSCILGEGDTVRFPVDFRVNDRYYDIGGSLGVGQPCPDDAVGEEEFRVHAGCSVLRLLQSSLLLLGGGLLFYGRTERSHRYLLPHRTP